MLILLTGGSACGKSTYAEELAVLGPKPLTYIAAMRPYDEECRRKIERHRLLRRDKGFETVERYTDLETLQLPVGGGTALLECMCNLTANEMFGEDGVRREVYEKILAGIEALEKQCALLLVVTNEVGGEEASQYGEGTAAYVSLLGRLNCALAQKADRVIELIAGIPLLLKGEK